MSQGAIPWVAAGSIVVLTVLNLRGLRTGALTQNILTLIKIGTLAAIAVFAMVLPGGNTAQPRATLARRHPRWS